MADLTLEQFLQGLTNPNAKVMYGNYHVNRVYQGATEKFVKNDNLSGMPVFTYETPSDVSNPFKPAQEVTQSLHPTFFGSSLSTAINLQKNPFLLSTNKNSNNSFCLVKFTVKNCSGGTVNIFCYQNSEKNYDYGIISKLDISLSRTSTADNATQYSNRLYGIDTSTYSPPWQLPPYTLSIPDNNTHTFEVKYRKDSSASIGDDLLAFYCYIQLADGTRIYPKAATASAPAVNTITFNMTATTAKFAYNNPWGETLYAINFTSTTHGIPSNATNVSFTVLDDAGLAAIVVGSTGSMELGAFTEASISYSNGTVRTSDVYGFASMTSYTVTISCTYTT